MSSRTALQQAMARIRLGRGMTTVEMATALGIKTSELYWIEAGKARAIATTPELRARLERDGFAQDPDGSETNLVERPFALPPNFEARVVATFALDESEQRTLSDGIAGLCEPPFPMAEELDEIRRQLQRAASGGDDA